MDTSVFSQRQKKGKSRRIPRPPGHRQVPVLVSLPPEPGVQPSPLPAVRIFMGTEPRQWRAERVLVWSIRRHRDPARAYEIHLMKDLEGFDRLRWTTGFTNFRFTIPHFAGNAGRGIYNDVDQIYLGDPAALFDTDMDGKAVLAISEDETSVMLLDCAALASLWRIEDAKTVRKKQHFIEPVQKRGLWGLMAGIWNARDMEYEAGVSQVLHYTKLPAQPWRPLPEFYTYIDHPHGEVWHDLEREADAAGFTVFTREDPSPDFRSMLQRGPEAIPSRSGLNRAARGRHGEALAALAGQHRPPLLLDLGGTGIGAEGIQARPVPLLGADGAVIPLPEEPTGAVVAIDALERLPEDDIPWVLREMFRAAKGFVYLGVTAYDPRARRPGAGHPHRTSLPPQWWIGQVETAARGFPDVPWRMTLRIRQGGLIPVPRWEAHSSAMGARA